MQWTNIALWQALVNSKATSVLPSRASATILIRVAKFVSAIACRRVYSLNFDFRVDDRPGSYVLSPAPGKMSSCKARVAGMSKTSSFLHNFRKT